MEPEGYDFRCRDCRIVDGEFCYIFDETAEYQPEYCPFTGHKLSNAMQPNKEKWEDANT